MRSDSSRGDCRAGRSTSRAYAFLPQPFRLGTQSSALSQNVDIVISSGTLDPFFMSIIRSLTLSARSPLLPPSLALLPESICLTCGACSRRRRRRRRRFVTACPSSEGVFARSVLFCKRHSETKGKLITPPSLRLSRTEGLVRRPPQFCRLRWSASSRVQTMKLSLIPSLPFLLSLQLRASCTTRTTGSSATTPSPPPASSGPRSCGGSPRVSPKTVNEWMREELEERPSCDRKCFLISSCLRYSGSLLMRRPQILDPHTCTLSAFWDQVTASLAS